MAENEIRKICSDIRQKWPVKHIAVFHRLGYDFLYQFKRLSVFVLQLCTNSDSEIFHWHPVLPWEGGSGIILRDCAFKGSLLYCNIWRVVVVDAVTKSKCARLSGPVPSCFVVRTLFVWQSEIFWCKSLLRSWN